MLRGRLRRAFSRAYCSDAVLGTGDQIDLVRHRSRTEAQWIAAASQPVRRIIDGVLARAGAVSEVSAAEGALLLRAGHDDAHAVLAAANQLRAATVGDAVTYVVNRNINFTNVCVKRCGFCAFSRTGAAAEGYYLPLSEILRRAHEAWSLGAT
jgi:2-iminoacetate synthase ThiH